MTLLGFEAGKLYRAYSDVNGDSARLRFLRYGSFPSGGLAALFEVVEIGTVNGSSSVFPLHEHVTAVTRLYTEQFINGFLRFPVFCSMGKNVEFEGDTFQPTAPLPGVKVEIYRDGDLDDRDPGDDEVRFARQLGDAKSDYYRLVI